MKLIEALADCLMKMSDADLERTFEFLPEEQTERVMHLLMAGSLNRTALHRRGEIAAPAAEMFTEVTLKLGRRRQLEKAREATHRQPMISLCGKRQETGVQQIADVIQIKSQLIPKDAHSK